ncbi:hypothetical protein ACIQWA_28550 [Kitasatospora sp. NPDC098652]
MAEHTVPARRTTPATAPVTSAPAAASALVPAPVPGRRAVAVAR